ncbi:MAG: hypothetical protein U0Q18_22005 [Bryobacteraceae bacterium]
MLKMRSVALIVLATAFICLPAVSLGQTISIVSGNGQVLCPTCSGNHGGFAFAPAVVLVKDANGNLSKGATVTWKETYSPLNLPVTTITVTSTTDTNGQATFTPDQSYPQGFASYGQTTLVATAGTSSVTFYETYAVPSATNSFAPISVFQLSPAVGTQLSGGVGSTGTTPIKMQVTSNGNGVPNVSVSLGPQPQKIWTTATISCASQAGQAPGVVLTDNTGIAICNPVFGNKIGSDTYQASVGGLFYTLTPEPFSVTVGAAAIIKVISGTPQNVKAGSIAPSPLNAQVQDLGGNKVPGAAVIWTVSPANSATLGSTVTTSDSGGNVSTRVTPTSAGQILVTVALKSNSSVKGTFTINATTTITAFSTVSGNNQGAAPGAAFANPLIVQVNNGSSPVPNVAVSFAVQPTGSVTLSSSTATTNAQGQAQVIATAGATNGSATVTASVSNGSQTLTQAFALTIISGPVISASGFQNAAGYQVGFISPCSLATIYGSGIAGGLQGFVSSFIQPPTQMAGVTVQFGTSAAPILSVVNENETESVTVQVPCDVAPGNVNVTVTADSGSTTVQNVPISAFSPGIFQTVMSDGKSRAVLVRPDGSFVSLENPARRGEIIRTYVTGLGQTTPPIATGQLVPFITDDLGNLTPQIMDTVNQVVVGVNNAGVRVVHARYAWNFIGVFEVAFEVPSDTATGNDVAFAVAIYSDQTKSTLIFGNGSSIPIQ